MIIGYIREGVCMVFRTQIRLTTEALSQTLVPSSLPAILKDYHCHLQSFTELGSVMSSLPQLPLYLLATLPS